VATIRSVTRVTRLLLLVEPELLTLPEYLSSSVARTARSLVVLCVVFCRSLYCLYFCNLRPTLGLSAKIHALHTGKVRVGIKNTKFVEDLPMIIPGQFGFNCPSGFRGGYGRT
jgi:hypothetical protein